MPCRSKKVPFWLLASSNPSQHLQLTVFKRSIVSVHAHMLIIPIERLALPLKRKRGSSATVHEKRWREQRESRQGSEMRTGGRGEHFIEYFLLSGKEHLWERKKWKVSGWVLRGENVCLYLLTVFHQSFVERKFCKRVSSWQTLCWSLRWGGQWKEIHLIALQLIDWFITPFILKI